ncbi:MAG: hypothetical protein HQL40_08270 [Alphaproteobacteria bacterium]|nr:hypothetical protein [Alphaproteobacteria bacterium]
MAPLAALALLLTLLAFPGRADQSVLVLVERGSAAARVAARIVVEHGLPRTRAVTIVGFDTAVSEATPLEGTGGDSADLEVALRFLADAPPAGWVVLIAEKAGPPWPDGIGGPPRSMLDDPRYAELNRLHDEFVAARATRSEIDDYFQPFYRQRAEALLEEQAERVRRALDGRLIVWDVGGRTEFLARWARVAGARHLDLPAGTRAQRDAALTALSSLTGGAIAAPARGGPSAVAVAGVVALALAVTVAAVLALRHRFRRRPRAEDGNPPGPFDPRGVPGEGEVMVRWLDAAGRSHKTNCLSLTPSEIVFSAEGARPARLQGFSCSRLGLDIQVVSSDTSLDPEGRGVAVLREFRNGIDDRMAMIALMTRVGESS